MNPCCVFIIFPLLLLLFGSATASQLVAVGKGGRDVRNGVVNKCSDKERHALLLFKAPLQDPGDRLSTWTADNHDCCEWSGVTCDEQTGHVTELKINSFDLGGEFSPSLLNLTYLNILHLYDNSFNGTVPTFIGSLRELRKLDLSYNNFNGAENLEWLSHLSHLEKLQMNGISLAKANHWVDVILSLRKLSYLSLYGCELSQVEYPYSFSFLNSSSSISHLDLGKNNLTSSMYRWLSPLTSHKLDYLDLSGNMLDGIPKYFCNLCGLESFSFDNNSAMVKFPDFLNNVSGCTSLTLKELYASNNQFTGSLPGEIHKFSSLEYLDLSDNHLNGSISEKLWELPKLTDIYLFLNNVTVPSTYHFSSLPYAAYVDLRSCKVGPRFPKWIQTLKNIKHLDLSNTGISDTTPLELWDMWPSQLYYLDLSSNNISGKVLDLLSNFADHSVIDLRSNSFYGQVLKVSPTLASLDLSRNNFSGGISFICQFVGGFLYFLDLSYNSFTGQLPDCLWHFKELKVLNLGHNNLFGSLPPSVEYLIKLNVLYLYKNNFSGELPFSLKKCTSLKSLNLGANNFSGNVPVWVGENLSGLYVLILRSNNLSGTIPVQLCQLANLQILDLSMNNLRGTIPSCLSNLTSMILQRFSQDVMYTRLSSHSVFDIPYTYIDHAMIQWQGDEREFFSTLKFLKSIDLSSNSLTGHIPYEITNLHDLIALNLSKNALFGEIPQEIVEMKRLLTLDLSRNSFSGMIPSSMSQMSLLNDLDVSFNNLSGRIPTSTQLQSFPPSRYDGNAGLCGLPLTKKCPGDKEDKKSGGKSKGDGEDIDELQVWFDIGGGIGFVTGFSIVCGTLLLNIQVRHAFFKLYDSFKDWVYVKVVVFIANLQKARLS